MSEIIVTAPDGPTIEGAADAADLLEGVAGTLAERYGDDFQMLATPEDPGVDRARVCAMTLDLYTEILALPKDDSVRLLRSMFAQ